MCICKTDPWIDFIPGYCIYDTWQLLSFILGTISLCLYIVALLPQIALVHKNKSVEGLSFSLILIWTVGDVTNLLGSIFANQLFTQQLTALYFVLLDIVLLSQFVYYSYAYPYKVPAEIIIPADHDANSSETDPLVARDPSVLEETITPVQIPAKTIAYIFFCTVVIPVVLFCASLWLSSASPSSLADPSPGDVYCDDPPIKSPKAKTFGTVMAWSSGLFYFFSRVPQIVLNYKNQSTEGLSYTVFVLLITANLSYSSSIMSRGGLNGDTNEFWINSFPFVLGSMGTLFFDFVILFQHRLYRKPVSHTDNDQDP